MTASVHIRRTAALAIAVAASSLWASEEEGATASLKTSWGVPDLQGTWDFRTMTPMSRPERFGDREFLTAEEVAKWEEDARKGREQWAQRSAADDPSQGDVDVGYDAVFIDTGTRLSRNMRTSLIVDPPNGRMPGHTRYALMRMAEDRETWSRRPTTAADRPPATRCLIGFNAGPPMRSSAYNNIMRVVQSPGYVAILNEMVNDHRVIPTAGGDHLPNSVRLWKGDSRGRWEGDTFIVETKNFRPETNFSYSGPNMHLTERFTRVDEDTLRYQYTMHDPESFEASWSTEQDMVATDDDVYEYACHEGNRAMHLMLAGARKEEREGVESHEGWLPSWFQGLPKKEDLLKTWAAEDANEGDGEE